MNNILLVGNGFDLAHGLPTSYNDFLYIMKEWDTFILLAKRVIKGESISADSKSYKFLVDAHNIDENNLDKLGQIIKDNSWIKYYCECEAEIDGWIDFEREIYPVIKLFEKVFSQTRYDQLTHGGTDTEAIIPRAVFDVSEINTARLWKKYFEIETTNLRVKPPYVSKQYGLLKKRIINSLKESFDEFILAFEIYLYEFVYKRGNVQALKQIKEINADYVISFNYTLTEKLYGISEENVHHIHGMIREDLASEKNNMVAGVNEQENQNMDFIYFVKYFQRIQKNSGVRYKSFINIEHENEEHETIREEYELYVYGHSLDETDEDILKYIIGNKDSNGDLKLKPKQVIIYYYDDFDYEQKVINLIKLYGRPIVEKYMEAKIFNFVPTSKELCNV